ncbi:hypothetical protein SS50377_23471 [Spironucleus salmonicida]|uniref:Uncharacterized protein n=1 Tax=Spironucleus salmonicida TaxID=348837 RepID=V6LZG1_9EUKA|nr:hypothetical protein SS50377_23471 [Spironucleus salmonicida]|eukprot:EST46209.1 Hypothetical protein SS50377_13804 [Spironucleus salmonicida]
MLKKLLGTMYKEDQFTIIAQGIMSNMALDMSKIPQAKKVILISPIVKFKIIINSEFKKKTNRINRISYVDEFSMQSELQLCQNDKMESEISGEIIEVKQECEQSHKLKYQALESKFVLVKIQNEELKQVKKIKSSEGHTTSIYKDVIINYEELGIVQNIISTNILKGQYLYTRSFNNLMYKIYSNKIIKQKICDTFRINSIYEDSRLQDVYQIIKQISSVNGTSKKKKLLSKYIIMFNIYSQLDKYNELNQQINMLDDDYFQSMQQFYNFQFIDASSVSNRTVCQVIVSPHDLLLSYSTLDTLQLMQQLNKVQVRTIIGTGHDILNATVVSIANLVFG